MRRAALAPLLVALTALPAAAHDFWIEPSSFRPALGSTVSASLRVGQKLAGEPVPRIPGLVERFVLRTATHERPALAEPGADPAGVVEIDSPGAQWLAYQSRAYPASLDAAKFEEYLRDEGLLRVAEARSRAGKSGEPGRERFYRCAKALLTAGDDARKGSTVTAPVGLALELVPESDPARLPSGRKLPLRLLFRGRPVADVLVRARSRKDPGHAVSARTDAAGRVTLEIAADGMWLINAVHMEAAAPGSGVDWESWWASLTFERTAGAKK